MWLMLVVAAGLMASPLGVADASEQRVNIRTVNTKETPRLTVSAQGRPYVAYGDREGRLLVRQPDGDVVTLSASGAQAAGFTSASAGKTVLVAWLEGRRGSPPTIVARRLDAAEGWSDLVPLDSASRPLPRIRLAGDDAGHVAILWLGDAPVASPEGSPVSDSPSAYHLYSRRSRDGGLTWGPTERLTRGYADGFWPALTIAGDRVHAFADARRDGKTLIVHTESDDALGWHPARPVKEVGSVLLVAAAAIEERPAVAWFGSDGGEYRLEAAVRAGTDWTTYRFPGSEAFDVGTLDLVAQRRTLIMVFSARSARQDAPSRKNHVYYSRSLDGGLSWEPIRALRHYAFDTTKDIFPQVAVTADGALLVAWNDYRNLRGDLYVNVSTDGGATWRSRDVAIDAPGQSEDVLFPFATNLRCAQADCFLLAARYRDDGLAEADLYLHSFSVSTLRTATLSAEGSDPVSGKAALESRVNAFWSALVAADYAQAYQLFDPYFRRRMRESDYVGQSGRVRQRSFNIEGIRLEGRVARVKVAFSYEIPALRLSRGGIYRKPETQARIDETWVFIDGDWHKEYHNEIGDFSFTRY